MNTLYLLSFLLISSTYGCLNKDTAVNALVDIYDTVEENGVNVTKKISQEELYLPLVVDENDIWSIESNEYNKTGLCGPTSFFNATHMAHVGNCSVINGQESQDNVLEENLKSLTFFAILGCQHMVDFAIEPIRMYRGLESTAEVFKYVTAALNQPEARLKCDVLNLYI